MDETMWDTTDVVSLPWREIASSESACSSDGVKM